MKMLGFQRKVDHLKWLTNQMLPLVKRYVALSERISLFIFFVLDFRYLIFVSLIIVCELCLLFFRMGSMIFMIQRVRLLHFPSSLFKHLSMIIFLLCLILSFKNIFIFTIIIEFLGSRPSFSRIIKLPQMETCICQSTIISNYALCIFLNAIHFQVALLLFLIIRASQECFVRCFAS